MGHPLSRLTMELKRLIRKRPPPSQHSEEECIPYTGLDRPTDEICGVEHHGCLICGDFVYIDNFGFIQFADGSYICSKCLGRDRSTPRPPIRLRGEWDRTLTRYPFM